MSGFVPAVIGWAAAAYVASGAVVAVVYVKTPRKTAAQFVLVTFAWPMAIIPKFEARLRDWVERLGRH